MPTEEHDSWLGSALGVAVDKLRAAAQTVEDDATKAKDWVDEKVDQAKDDLNKAADWVKGEVQKGTDLAQKAAGTVVGEVKKDADAAKMKVLGDQSGKQVPRPMEGDCKPAHGYVPGPKNHLLCSTHGHVVDVDQQMIIAESVASYAKQGAARVVAGGAGAISPDSPSSAGAPVPTQPQADDGEISKLIADATAAFAPVIKLPTGDDFNMADALSQAANEVVAKNAPELPVLERAETLVEEARRILDVHMSPDVSLDLPDPTILFSGKCCSADELQRFRTAIEAPRNAALGSINAFKDTDRAVAEAAEQGKKICYGALITCVVGSLVKPGGTGVAACVAGAIACIGGAFPVQNAIRQQAKAQADLEVANGALERALANFRNAYLHKCEPDPRPPPGVR